MWRSAGGVRCGDRGGGGEGGEGLEGEVCVEIYKGRGVWRSAGGVGRGDGEGGGWRSGRGGCVKVCKGGGGSTGGGGWRSGREGGFLEGCTTRVLDCQLGLKSCCIWQFVYNRCARHNRRYVLLSHACRLLSLSVIKSTMYLELHLIRSLSVVTMVTEAIINPWHVPLCRESEEYEAVCLHNVEQMLAKARALEQDLRHQKELLQQRLFLISQRLNTDHWHVSIWCRWGSSWFVKCWVTLTSEVIGCQRNSSHLTEGWITIDWQFAAAEILHDWLNYGLDNTVHLGTPESLLLLLCSGWVVQFSNTLFIPPGAILSDVSVNHLNLKALPLLGCTAFQCCRSQSLSYVRLPACTHTRTHTHTQYTHTLVSAYIHTTHSHTMLINTTYHSYGNLFKSFSYICKINCCLNRLEINRLLIHRLCMSYCPH